MTAERSASAVRVTVSRKTLRTMNTIEQLHEEFCRRVKTQGSLPSEDAVVVSLFSLVASGQSKLRRIDGWRKIAAVLSPADGGRCARISSAATGS